jgi:hypothetical protein
MKMGRSRRRQRSPQKSKRASLTNVRYWHLADIGCALQMSAFDPKRTKADAVGLSAMCPNSCRQLGLLDQLVGARDEPDLHQCRERDILAPAT